MKVAAAPGRAAGCTSLGEMAKALDKRHGRARRIRAAHRAFKIPIDKIREVIGTGGKVSVRSSR